MPKIILTSDGSHTLISANFDETYHSSHGAIEESKHVFIKSGINYFVKNNLKRNINIFELGMGSGLNVLLSVFESSKSLQIAYTTIELYPLDNDCIELLNYPAKLHPSNSNEVFRSIHNSAWNNTSHINDYFALHKIQGNIKDQILEQKYDIVFYDAFGPKTQPDLWNIESIQKMYDLLLPNGILVTYCAMGQFKRDLKNVGFEVQSIPGPPGKREMTRAVKI